LLGSSAQALLFDNSRRRQQRERERERRIILEPTIYRPRGGANSSLYGQRISLVLSLSVVKRKEFLFLLSTKNEKTAMHEEQESESERERKKRTPPSPL